jgi:hypothetical protein
MAWGATTGATALATTATTTAMRRGKGELVLEGHSGFPSFPVEDLGDEGGEVGDANLDRFTVLVSKPRREADL